MKLALCCQQRIVNLSGSDKKIKLRYAPSKLILTCWLSSIYNSLQYVFKNSLDIIISSYNYPWSTLCLTGLLFSRVIFTTFLINWENDICWSCDVNIRTSRFFLTITTSNKWSNGRHIKMNKRHWRIQTSFSSIIHSCLVSYLFKYVSKTWKKGEARKHFIYFISHCSSLYCKRKGYHCSIKFSFTSEIDYTDN